MVLAPNAELVPLSSAGRRTIQAFALSFLLIAAALGSLGTDEARRAGAAAPRKGLTWLSGAGAGKVDPGLDRAGSEPLAVIVQASAGAAAAAAAAVQAGGGEVGGALPLINGFEATVPASALGELAADPAVEAVTGNRTGRFTQQDAGAAPASTYASSTGAADAWRQDVTGRDIGVAVIDTGISPVNDLKDRLVLGPDLSGEGSPIDTFGHGTVMAGLIAGDGTDSSADPSGGYVGMAPDARVIAVKAAGADGVTDVATILRAMQWVSAYRTEFNIRVVNLAWGTASTQSPALDPLNYAVERLWSEGIVVVVAAGNAGPGPRTITKPADDPMVITVGALDERGDTDSVNDTVPNWSSRGPTAAGVAKPDLVAPGRTLVSTRSFGSRVERENPDALIGSSYIKGSGTSQAAAVTSGAAALVLAAHPEYTPDQVKAVLTGSASPVRAESGQAGAGRLQVAAALSAAPGPASWQAAPAMAGTGLGGDPAGWTGSSWTGNGWTGSSWTGNGWTGSSWTGSSWTGSSWTGNGWTGSSWTGSSWTGSSWTGSSWTGSSWTGNGWTGNGWTGSSWTGNGWTGSSWTGSSWTSAFWGEKPKAGQQVAGEAAA